MVPKKFAFKAWWATSLNQKAIFSNVFRWQGGLFFGNFKLKFTFTQVICTFFSRLKELTFKKYCYVSSSVIGLSPLKQEFNNVKWTIIELNMTWLTVIINLKKLKCTQKLIRSMKQKILKWGSYDQGEIMMFDDCKSKNMPGQFTTAHISGCGIYINTVDLRWKISTFPQDHLMQQPNHCILQLAATIEGITICNMWLGWQILTFIKLQILFNLRHNILQYDCVHHKSYLVADVVPILMTSCIICKGLLSIINIFSSLPFPLK